MSLSLFIFRNKYSILTLFTKKILWLKLIIFWIEIFMKIFLWKEQLDCSNSNNKAVLAESIKANDLWYKCDQNNITTPVEPINPSIVTINIILITLVKSLNKTRSYLFSIRKLKENCWSLYISICNNMTLIIIMDNSGIHMSSLKSQCTPETIVCVFGKNDY